MNPANSAIVSYTLHLNSTQEVSAQVIEQLAQLHGVIAVVNRSGKIFGRKSEQAGTALLPRIYKTT